MTPVRYHPAAEDELLNEIGYLELRVPGLGRRFYAEVRRAESLIAQFPESAREVLPRIRKRSLRKFPFSLIYSIERDDLLTLAVARHNRRPRYWLPRAGETKGEPH
jgi:plasmid stabilization system protein ParE